MPNSMTAYGRATSQTPFGQLTIEIQSVNRKHLEINLMLPRELVRFEADMRGWLAPQVHRGQVTVRVQATYTTRTPIKVVPNLPLAKELKQAWDKISTSLGMNGATNFHLEMLAHESELFSYEEALEDEEIYRDALQATLADALQHFLAMRQREGQALAADIAQRVQRMKSSVEEIAVYAAASPNKYRDKLLGVLEQVMSGVTKDDERLLREVCLFADRIDIAEEVTRAQSHFEQLESLLGAANGPVGKTIEFLLQELFREVNTIASKSSDVQVTRRVIDLKAEIERIREQIQNIE